MTVERDEQGRWLPGTASPNPKGRGSARREKEYNDAIKGAVTPEEMAAATRKIYEHIMETGSIRAYVALADRLGGKPAPMPEEDGADLGTYILGLLQPKPAEPEAISADYNEA